MKQKIKLSDSVTEVCAKSYQKVMALVNATRASIMTQFRDLAAEHEHALHLALNEAEALAWQTEYPQLVFQDLAEEKVRGFAKWVAHQRAVRSSVRL